MDVFTEHLDRYDEDAYLYSDELLSIDALLERVCIPVEDLED